MTKHRRQHRFLDRFKLARSGDFPPTLVKRAVSSTVGPFMSTAAFEKSRRNKLLRHPERGQYERDAIYAIVDEALMCHVGFIQDGSPIVIPTLHARDGDSLLLHGSAASRMIKHLGARNPVCVTITLVDGLVLARSVFNHSVNYRSAVLFGTGEPITDPEAKRRALLCFMERLLPGRWADVREPTEQELKATGVVAIPLAAASAKVRSGPPKDDPDDVALPSWAGVLPIRQIMAPPEPAPDGPPAPDLPEYLAAFLAAHGDH
ncbi:MAG TPA: pyridoxamine 5'-phosphate oxidase family protein [Chloroflexota bacterium]|jgi:hypothetical protein|nr:pyridoxamine 5'-phosphate oxidase family protein [Chloroflexota bacterium]